MELPKKIFFILLLFLLTFSHNSLSQALKWKGKKTLKNGVTHIYNPEKPVYYKKKPPYVKLKKILSIGIDEGDENYVFGRIFDIAFDSFKNIFILDSPNHCIKVFDDKGKFVKTIGRYGQGPGEFNKPFGIEISSMNQIIVHDLFNNRISIFNKDGIFQQALKQPVWTTRLLLNKNDEIIIIRQLNANTFKMYNEKYFPITHFNIKGKQLRTYGNSHIIKQKGYSKFAENITALLPNNNLLVACAYPYKIIEYDSKGKVIREISKHDKLFEDIALIKKKGLKNKIITNRARISRLLTLPDGGFLIKIQDFGKDWKNKMRKRFGTLIECTIIIDYYDNDGKFLARFHWNEKEHGNLFFIDEDGYAYTNIDKNDIPKLTKYKLNLNDSF